MSQLSSSIARIGARVLRTRWFVRALGFGERAQWCRNVMVDPEARAWWGTRGPRPVRVDRLSLARSRELIGDYARQHPRAWRTLRATLEQTAGVSLAGADFTLPMFALNRRP